MSTNPYEILGVDKNCDDNTIKKAYRKLSLQYHPDRNNSAESNSKMLEINSAYEEIGTPDQRKKYDSRMNSANLFNGGFHSEFPQGSNDDDDDSIDVSHLMNMFFAGGLGGAGHNFVFHGHNFSRQLQKPPAIIKNVRVSLEQCYHGCDVPFDVERWVIKNDMKVMQTDTMHVRIPEGSDTNDFFVIRERGNEVNEHLIGDIKIIIKVENHESFVRNGLDLTYKKTISLKESLCGFSFDFKHLNGDISLTNAKNPTIIHNKIKKTIAKMGMKRDKCIGNLIIEFDVEFPSTLSQEQIKALESIL